MLDLHFVNVGNGDCIVVDYQGPDGRAVGVIDCNSDGRAESPAVKKLDSLGVNELSFVCLTHPDHDHYSGLFSVLTKYDLQHFYTFPIGDISNNPKYVEKLFDNYREMVGNLDDPLTYQRGVEFLQIIMFATDNFVSDERWEELSGPSNTIAPTGFEGVGFDVILPLKFYKGAFFEHIQQGRVGVEAPIANNKISVALRLTYAGSSILLGGDAPEECWNRHRNTWQRRLKRSIASDVVKLPHHGSKRDCTPSVLNDIVATASGETVTVISADGKYHPHAEVVSWLNSANLRNYCTNLFAGYGGTVRELLRERTLDPVLNRLLNEYADVDLTRAQPCKGDICVRIAPTGARSVACSSPFACLCDPVFRDLLS